MTTIIGISLLAGVTLGMFLGVPLGRVIERIRPAAKDDDGKKKKSKR